MHTAIERPYFVGPVTDFLFMGGLSVAALLCAYVVWGSELSLAAAQFSVALTWVVNHPHFSATNYRLYRRRDAWQQFPLTATLLPILIVSGTIAALLSPEQVAPVWIKLFLIWSPFHFSGQNIGLTLLYARRHGVKFEQWERWILTAFIYFTFIAPTLASEVGIHTHSYHSIFYPTLNVAPQAAQFAWGLLWLLGTALLVVIARRQWLQRSVHGWILWVPALAQLSWFVLGSRVPNFYYFVPAFHSLQYLLVAWALQMRDLRVEHGATQKVWDPARETLMWLALNTVGGIVLFAGFPWLVQALGIAAPLATGVVIASIQLHHFIVDGVIWKLRDSTSTGRLVADPAPSAQVRAA